MARWGALSGAKGSGAFSPSAAGAPVLNWGLWSLAILVPPAAAYRFPHAGADNRTRPCQTAAQEHFYLEPNASVVVPGEADEMVSYSSTQVRRKK